jgi:hypothetical protein
MIRLDNAITKSVGSTWAAGTGQGGLDTGTVENNQWYHVLAIRNVAGVKDILLTKTITSVAMPAGYQWKRRIGSLLTNSAAQITDFVQQGDYFWWKVPVVEKSGALQTAGRELVTVAAPPNSTALLSALVTMTSNATEHVMFTHPDQSDSTPSSSMFNFVVGAGNGAHVAGGGMVNVGVDENSQLGIRGGSTSTITVMIHGYIDRRGRDD